ncbi:MAG: GWxTD domain-containing protein [Bacteroidetes bacterium]|nr:GWxTD domain-containing protein [Bacteroidota bacterium]
MKTLLLLVSFMFSGAMFSNVIVYFNYGIFSTPANKPYIETYLTITGNTVRYKPVKGGYQASVSISYIIRKGADTVKVSKYNLLSPVEADTLHKSSFIDNQRFQLNNGTYTLYLEVADNNNPGKPSTYHDNITVNMSRTNRVYSSTIQPLESYSKSAKPSAISKNGYDMVPYNVNYYPDAQNSLKFYFETYNLDTVIGKNSKFVYSYYIEEDATLKKQDGLSGFQKQAAKPVNPLLAQFDLSTLPSGNYNLVIEVRDSAGIMQYEKKWYFQRKNTAVQVITDINADVKIKTIEDFFNQFQSADSLKMFVECLWPISTMKEREWEQTQAVKKEPALMRNFLVDFWKKESGDTIDPLKIWIPYYKSTLEAMALFKCGKQKGYYTDRGRVYLQYGKPDQRSQMNSSSNSYPYEVWQYYRLRDAGSGQFFTNKKFVFANFNIADDCYQLIHSDAKGEIYDEKWRYRLVTRSQQSQNVDDTQPVNTYGNNSDDLFNNPR